MRKSVAAVPCRKRPGCQPVVASLSSPVHALLMRLGRGRTRSPQPEKYESGSSLTHERSPHFVGAFSVETMTAALALNWRLVTSYPTGRGEGHLHLERRRFEMRHEAMRIPAEKRPVTPAEQRLLNVLSRPATFKELALSLGVTHQRVRQLVDRLVAKDLIKISDKASSNIAIARIDDPTVLLNELQARALSALIVDQKSLTRSVGTTLKTDESEATVVLSELKFNHLVTKVEHFDGRDAWMLTEEGIIHPQRRQTARTAKLAPTGIKSERSINVLSLLANDGPTRGKDISGALNLDRTSLNAFMQYLKRKGWIRKAGTALADPYELTEAGLKVLDGLSG